MRSWPSSARLLPSSSSGRGGLRPAGAQQCRPTSAPAMQSRGGSSGRAVSAAGPRASRSWRVAPRAPCAAEALWRRVRTPPAILDEDSADRDANNAAGGIGRGLGRPGRQQRRRRYWTRTRPTGTPTTPPAILDEERSAWAKIPGVAIMPPVPRVAGRRCTTHLISACRPFDPRRRRTAGRASAVRTQPLATATCQ
jgi:hypothetical protein